MALWHSRLSLKTGQTWPSEALKGTGLQLRLAKQYGSPQDGSAIVTGWQFQGQCTAALPRQELSKQWHHLWPIANPLPASSALLACFMLHLAYKQGSGQTYCCEVMCATAGGLCG